MRWSFTMEENQSCSFRLKDLEMAKKISEDLEKKCVRGNDKTLKTDYVRHDSDTFLFECVFV